MGNGGRFLASGRERAVAAVALAVVALCVFVGMNTGFADKAPWDSDLEGTNFSFAAQGEGGAFYAVDNGGVRMIAFDADGRHLWDVNLGNTTIRRIAPGPDGGVFISTFRFAQDNRVEYAGIDEYDKNGRRKRTVYSAAYEGDDMPMYSSGFLGLRCADGWLYYVEKEATGLTLYRLSATREDAVPEQLRRFPLVGAEGRVLAAACDPLTQDVYFVDKLGGVWLAAEDAAHRALAYPEPPEEPAFSIPYSVALTGDGLYVSDIGTRELYALGAEGARLAADLGNGVPIEESPMLYYQIDAAAGGGVVLCSRYDILLLDGGEIAELPVSFAFSAGMRVLLWCWWGSIAVIAAALIAVIALLLRRAYNRVGLEKMLSSVMLIAVVAVVTVIAMTQYSGGMDATISEMTMDNLSGQSLLTAARIDGDLLRGISTLADYDTPAYRALRESLAPVAGNDVRDVLYDTKTETFDDHEADWDAGVYRMVLRVIDGRVCYIYSSEDQWGALYPMDYPYEDTEFQIAYEQDAQVAFSNILDYTGEYTYTITPIHDSDGEVVGVLEMGIDRRAFREETNALLRDIALNVVVVVLVVVLLMNEVTFFGRVVSKRVPRGKKELLDVDAVRPLVFLIYLLDCFGLIISPFFAQQLYTETLGIPMEVGVALAYSVTFLFLGVAALVGGRLSEKVGLYPLVLAGTGLLLVGELLAAASASLLMFVGAKAVVGLGAGLLLNAADTFVAMHPKSEDVERGFSMSNVALNSGTNCGIIIGTAIGAAFGYPMVFLAASGIAVVMLLYILLIFRKNCLPDVRRDHVARRHGMSFVKFIFSRRVFSYFVFMIFPYLVLNAFIYYFLPLEGGKNGMSEELISQIVFAYGMVSIYVGPMLTGFLLGRFKARATLVIGGALLVGALLLYAFLPSISILMVSVILFALADSFSFPAQNIYFAQLPEAQRYGSGAALGVNNVVSGLASTASSYCFAAAMIVGTQFGLIALGVLVAGFFLMFILTSAAKKEGASDAAHGEA